jgi:hypothetical protein
MISCQLLARRKDRKMSKSKRLYFIPIIDNALGSDSPELALRAAFKKIHELGMTKEYKEGFVQFRLFMGKIVEAYVENSPDREQLIRENINSLISDLVTDSFEGSEDEKKALIESIARNDRWQTEYERMKSELADFMETHPPMGIEVLKDREPIASFAITEVPITLMNIDPGKYTIRLSTGRVLWEDQLQKKHLIWLDAYGDEDLRMAAKTEEDDAAGRPTVSDPLMGGELIMKVIPSLKSGEIHFDHGKKR